MVDDAPSLVDAIALLPMSRYMLVIKHCQTPYY
nr:MAG TPA: hypothetical protein [Caudoviricetes sp.]